MTVSLNARAVSQTTLPPGEYAVVEQLGHATLVGRIETVERFGVELLSVEPLFCGWMLPAVLLGGASIYRLTPTRPETAWSMRAKYRHELPPSVCALVPNEPDPSIFTAETVPAFLQPEDAAC